MSKARNFEGNSVRKRHFPKNTFVCVACVCISYGFFFSFFFFFGYENKLLFLSVYLFGQPLHCSRFSDSTPIHQLDTNSKISKSYHMRTHASQLIINPSQLPSR